MTDSIARSIELRSTESQWIDSSITTTPWHHEILAQRLRS